MIPTPMSPLFFFNRALTWIHALYGGRSKSYRPIVNRKPRHCCHVFYGWGEGVVPLSVPFSLSPFTSLLMTLRQAMHPLDRATGQPRGFFRLEATAVCPVWATWKMEQDECLSGHTRCVSAVNKLQKEGGRDNIVTG